jgi:acetyl-CoA carboxylase carboxyltransferase component
MMRSALSTSRWMPFRRALSSWGEVLNGSLPATPDISANKARMDEIVAELKNTVAKVHLGGGEKAQAKQKARNKLIARDRVNALVDPGTPFLELSTLAAYDMYNDWIPSGGIITGIGRVNGYEHVVFFRPFCELLFAVLSA